MKVLNAHVYEYENNKGEHFVPGPDSQIIPVLYKLAEIGCHWWVLELYTQFTFDRPFYHIPKNTLSHFGAYHFSYMPYRGI